MRGFEADFGVVPPEAHPPQVPQPVPQPTFGVVVPSTPNQRRGRIRRATCNAANATINPTSTPSSIVSLPPTRAPFDT